MKRDELAILAGAFAAGAVAGYVLGRTSASSPKVQGIMGVVREGFALGQQGAAVPLEDVVANLVRIGARHALGGSNGDV